MCVFLKHVNIFMEQLSDFRKHVNIFMEQLSDFFDTREHVYEATVWFVKHVYGAILWLFETREQVFKCTAAVQVNARLRLNARLGQVCIIIMITITVTKEEKREEKKERREKRRKATDSCFDPPLYCDEQLNVQRQGAATALAQRRFEYVLVSLLA